MPIDNRPVTAVFPVLLCGIAGVEPLVPPRALLGRLTEPSQAEPLRQWIETTIKGAKPESLLLSLDSYLWGGLVNSRRGHDNLGQAVNRVNYLAEWRRFLGSEGSVLAQSSIMRISDNYDAVEEPEYWASWGREIFAWSGYLHRAASGQELPPGALTALEAVIPQAVRQDYLERRWRNFQVNRRLLSLVESGELSLLIFSLDDSGQFGLNMLEMDRLMFEAHHRGLTGQVMSYPGADEVLSTMLARWLIQREGSSPRVKVEFSPERCSHFPSRYEGQPIGATVGSQLMALDVVTQIEPYSDATHLDFTVVIHGGDLRQGDHIRLPDQPDLTQVVSAQSVHETVSRLERSEVPCVICDVAYANGADPALVEVILRRPDLVDKLWGYAGWNTTGNTIGSAVAMGVACWFAKRRSVKREVVAEGLKRALFVRFADDWAYQTKVRPHLDKLIPVTDLACQMSPYLDTISQALSYLPERVQLCFPWERTFEVEIIIDN